MQPLAPERPERMEERAGTLKQVVVLDETGTSSICS
jgi:hypothetical protein